MSEITKTPVETTAVDRGEFLASFNPEKEKQIARKVDKRFFLLIGLMYMVKLVFALDSYPSTDTNGCQIDSNNVSSIKVLQEGQPSNILTELNMSANQYNWVSSVYTVCLALSGQSHSNGDRSHISYLKHRAICF